MTVICLGPCCIPVSALLPLLLLVVAPILRLLRRTPLAKYLPDPGAKQQQAGGKCQVKCCTTDEGQSTEEPDVYKVSSLDELERIKSSRSLVIIDVTATWCKPCKKIAPVFEQLAATHRDSATFLMVDVDELPEAFDGALLPTFQVYKDGVKTDSVRGPSEKRLRMLVSDHCKKDS